MLRIFYDYPKSEDGGVLSLVVDLLQLADSRLEDAPLTLPCRADPSSS